VTVLRERPGLLVSGRIATLAGAAGFAWVQAIAIAGGRVVAAGTLAEVGALARAGTRRWALPSTLVALPAITDGHLHLADAALAARRLDLAGAGDLDAVLAAVRATHEARATAGDPDGWLLGHGWSLDRLGSWPSAGLLERAAPGRPVALWSHDHHSRWVSQRALALADLDSATADPVGGRIGRDADGRPDGMLYEDAARLVDRAIPEPETAELSSAVSAYAAGLARLGVVGAHDPGELGEDASMRRGPTFYRALAAAGTLPMRVVASIREPQLDAAIGAGVRTGRGVPVSDRDPVKARAAERYRDGWLKLFSDGALGSRSAALLEPYEAADPAGPGPGGPRGMVLRTGEELALETGTAAAAGIASQIHGIGDAAVRLTLDVLAQAPRLGRVHHRVEHAQLVAPADRPRFAALGVAASVQPCHLINDAPAMRVAWGARTAHAFPLAALDAAGALLAFGTDAPVEPPDPWPGIAVAVSRHAGTWPPSDGPVHPEAALALTTTLRAATAGPARTLGVDDEGHLGVGARADLIVIPADALEEPVRPGGALERCRPLATLLDGEPAWLDPTFDP
jgi:hypothetical protein